MSDKILINTIEEKIIIQSSEKVIVNPIETNVVISEIGMQGAKGDKGDGILSINGLTNLNQNINVNSNGNDFNIVSNIDTHTINLPSASSTKRGALTSTDWQTFNNKQDALGFTPENIANKENTTLDNSITKYPTNFLVKNNLDLKVDKVAGERLINASEIIKLSNTSGVNTGDQDLSSYAPLNSPNFTGTPTAPTPTNGDNSTKIATTAFVLANGGGVSDATTTTKGIVQLSGDLEGTAVLPTVKNASVISKILTGLSTATNAIITASDTILSAFGKLQKQISDNLTVLNNKQDTLSGTGVVKSTAGTISYINGTSDQYIDGTGTTQTFPSFLSADKLITEVYNETGATLTKGTVVYINGSHGSLPTVAKSIATSDATSAQTLGLVQNDITNNNNGFIIVRGKITDLDTQSYINGTQLYLSGTTAGTYTSIKTYAPIHLVSIGIVVRSHPTQGIIEVAIQNGFEIGESHDVSAQSPSNNDGLFYNTSTSLWENKSISTAIGYTPYNATNPNNYIALTNISATTPISYSSSTGVISISQSNSTTNGYLSSSDWNTFYNKQNTLTLTTTGTSGASTLIGNTLNIPQYSGGGGSMVYPSAGIAVSNGTSWDTSITNNSSNWNTAYSNRIDNLTVLGTSGASTLIDNTLNIPTYTIAGLGGALDSEVVKLTGNQTISGVKTFNDEIILAPNTITSPSVSFNYTSSVLQTIPNVGDMETDADGLLYYTHDQYARGVVNATQFTISNAPYTLLSQTTGQPLFSLYSYSGIYLKAATTYYFECFFSLTNMSASSGSFGFGLRTSAPYNLTFSSLRWQSVATKTASLPTASSPFITSNSATFTNNLTAANTSTTGWAKIDGHFKTNSAGVLIPSVYLGVASAAIVGANSYFKITAIGTNTVLEVGNWI